MWLHVMSGVIMFVVVYQCLCVYMLYLSLCVCVYEILTFVYVYLPTSVCVYIVFMYVDMLFLFIL